MMFHVEHYTFCFTWNNPKGVNGVEFVELYGILLTVLSIVLLSIVALQKDTVKEVKRDHEILFQQYNKVRTKLRELDKDVK